MIVTNATFCLLAYMNFEVWVKGKTIFLWSKIALEVFDGLHTIVKELVIKEILDF